MSKYGDLKIGPVQIVGAFSSSLNLAATLDTREASAHATVGPLTIGVRYH